MVFKTLVYPQLISTEDADSTDYPTITAKVANMLPTRTFKCQSKTDVKENDVVWHMLNPCERILKLKNG